MSEQRQEGAVSPHLPTTHCERLRLRAVSHAKLTMSTMRHLVMAALVVMAGATPVLSGCPSISTSVAPRPPTPTSPLPAEAAAAGSAPVVPVAFLEDSPWQPSGKVAPPITLHAADGTELALRTLKGRSVIQGPLAFTELELGFDNQADRTVEGRFRIALPPGAAVSRFAMRIDGRWQEAEVVEQKRARRTYEDFLHRKQDPALLEQAAGNEFSARVFPIPARATKQLIISYSQELTSHRRTLVPLRGLPAVEQLDLAVVGDDGRASTESIRRAAYAPTGDFAIDAGPATATTALRSGDLLVARIHPPVSTAPDPLDSAVVLVDTSASRALGLLEELRLVQRLAAHVATTGGDEAPFAVAAFDQQVEPLLVGAAAQLDAPKRHKLASRGALGASNVRQALRWAGKTARQIGARRVVLITDGVATAGSTEPASLRQASRKLGDAGVKRVDVVAVGGIRDDPLLHAVVTAGLERDGVVADGEQPWPAVVQRLVRRTASDLPVTVAGAAWSWPQKLDGVQADDDLFVYARLPLGHPVRIAVDGTLIAGVEVAEVERPLLERAWAGAKIASLLDAASRDSSRAAVRDEIIELSTKHRVLSPYTSLLVLETEADYRRFGLERRALADILTIEQDGLTVRQRSGPARAPSPSQAAPPELRAQRPPARPGSGSARPPRATGSAPSGPTAAWARDDSLGIDPMSARGNMWGDEIGESFGGGGLGLVGKLSPAVTSGVGEGGGGRGEGIGLGSVGTIGRGAATGTGQGFGNGHGRLGRSHRARPPRVRMGATSVSGRLPPEIIQRIVRMRFGTLRQCYEDALRRNPNAAGRIVARFVIGRDGKVRAVRVTSSEIDDTTMLRELERSFAAMRFPAPEGGLVTVSYPIVFSPEGSAPPPARRNDAARAPQRSAATAPERSPSSTPALRGELAGILEAIEQGKAAEALEQAVAWRRRKPGEVLALVAMGEAYEALAAHAQAARSYGSIIDLFPHRADLRRFAGARLERVAKAGALELAVDTYRKARKQRPDHPSSHRLLAFALLKSGAPAEAFSVLSEALARRYPGGRFRGVEQVLREDLGLAAAAWMRAEPARADHINERLEAAGGRPERHASLRFVLTWETDANDVDLHVHDAEGGHAYYSTPELPGGGKLYADVTTGYGPECFTIRKARDQRSRAYRLQAHYYARGPMGYGMGKVQVIDHDGRGGLSFEERPFVVMNDHAFVSLGTIRGSKPAAKPVASR